MKLKLALSILVGTMILGAICQSYMAVGISPDIAKVDGPLSRPKFETSEESPSDDPQAIERRETAEKELWRNGKLSACDKMLDADWRVYSKENSDAGRSRFRHKAAMLANLRLDFVNYKQAADCFKIILKQDEYYQNNSLSIASDYNNVGLCLGLAATICNDKKKKQSLFFEAMQNLKEAQNRFQNLDKKEALFSCLANQYTLLQDMHESATAKNTFAQMKELNNGSNGKLRELLIEQDDVS